MCISYALKHDLEFSLPNYTRDPHWNPLYLQHLVNPKWVQGREDVLINENGMQYQEVPFKEEWINKQIVLNGYWQTEKYFKDYRKEIIYLFDFPYELKKDVVSIHIRRGDYLHLRQKHPEVKKEWYEQAIAMFPDKQFKFFSDDISWCAHTFGSGFMYSSNKNEVDDLVEMSCCEHNICSASTFSWWGMWLNQNEDKKVVFPNFWFAPKWGNLNTNDVVPEWCIKL